MRGREHFLKRRTHSNKERTELIPSLGLINRAIKEGKPNMSKKSNKPAPTEKLTPAQQLAALRAQLEAQQKAIADAEAQIEQVEDAARVERETLISSLPEKLGVDSLATVALMVSAMVKHGTIKPAGRSLKDGERKQRTSLLWSQIKEACEARAKGDQWSALNERYGVSNSFFNARFMTLGFTCASVQSGEPIPAKLVKALDDEIASEAQKEEEAKT